MCLSYKSVHNWFEQFSQGSFKIRNKNRSGLLIETELTVQQMVGLIRGRSTSDHRQHHSCNRMFSWFSIKYNAGLFEFSKGVCTLYPLKTDRGTQNIRIGLFLQLLFQYANEVEAICNRIITDESWVHLLTQIKTCFKCNNRSFLLLLP